MFRRRYLSTSSEADVTSIRFTCCAWWIFTLSTSNSLHVSSLGAIFNFFTGCVHSGYPVRGVLVTFVCCSLYGTRCASNQLTLCAINFDEFKSVRLQRLRGLPEPSDSKLQWVPWDSEARITVLARANRDLSGSQSTRTDCWVRYRSLLRKTNLSSRQRGDSMYRYITMLEGT
jgi:hypothetical protein